MGEITGYSADGVNGGGAALHGVAHAISKAALDPAADISHAFNGDESLGDLEKMTKTLAEQIHEVSQGVLHVSGTTAGKLSDAASLVTNTGDDTASIASGLNHL